MGICAQSTTGKNDKRHLGKEFGLHLLLTAPPTPTSPPEVSVMRLRGMEFKMLNYIIIHISNKHCTFKARMTECLELIEDHLEEPGSINKRSQRRGGGRGENKLYRKSSVLSVINIHRIRGILVSWADR